MSFKKLDEESMRLAIAKAKQGIQTGQTPFGACIVKKGRVIACAHNVVWKSTDSTAHAEIHAIRQACRRLKTIDLSGSILYSTCEPCPMCFGAIHWAKISTVMYGAAIKDARAAGFSELGISNRRMQHLGKSPVKIFSGLLAAEARPLFTEWKKSGRAKVY